MSSPKRLTIEQENSLLINAESFRWENFAHKPLNIFDAGPWTVCFPGDISADRELLPFGYAAYQFDINDLETCPRYAGPGHYLELWNESSQEISWLLGRQGWCCIVPADGFVLTSGDCRIGVAITRFRNIDGVSDLTRGDELRLAQFSVTAQSNKEHNFKPLTLGDCFQKTINGMEWEVIKTRNALGSPVYSVATPLDYRTAITVELVVGSAWVDGEEIPENVEEKYVASFWDFLSHITLSPSRESDTPAGTIERFDPEKVVKEENNNSGW